MFSPYMTALLLFIPVIAIFVTYSSKDKLIDELDNLIQKKPLGGIIGIKEVEDSLMLDPETAFKMLCEAENEGVLERILYCECENCHHKTEFPGSVKVLDCPICHHKTVSSATNKFVLFHKV